MTAVKAVVVLSLTALAARLGELIVPLCVLAGVMLADYLTGLASAWFSRSLSSRVGISGIVCKLLRLAAVAVGFTVDWLLQMGIFELWGVPAPGGWLFGLLVTLWLVVNELISILENLSECGLPLPGFLRRLLSHLAAGIEAAGDAKVPGNEKPPEDREP